MIATNSLPRFNDKTYGIWRRILLVPFDKTIAEEKQVRNYAEFLRDELSGILNWAIEGLEKLGEAGRFTIPEGNSEFIEQYRRDSDPTRAFLMESFTTSPNSDGIGCTELYQLYRDFCEENGCRPMSNRTFGHQVRRIFPETERARVGPRGQREYVYKGLVPSVSYVS